MSQGRLRHAIKDYRARLKAHEAQAERALEQAYRATLARIEPALTRLYTQMVDAMAGGEKIPAHWLYEARRLESLKTLIEHEITIFAGVAQAHVTQTQQGAVALGKEAALDLLQATVPPGVSWSFGLPSHDAIASLVGATQAGSPLADLFRGFGKEASDKAAQALITGVMLGDNPRTIAPRVQQALGISRARALTISRTEAIRGYREANLATFQANDDVCDGWIWSADLGSACAVCTAMNGTKHGLDETLDSHPNCRCVPAPQTKDWSNILAPLGIDTIDIPDTQPSFEDGTAWFKRQSAQAQRDILGSKAAYAAYQDGALSLSDLVGKAHSQDWGASRYQKSLKEVLGAKKARSYYGK